MEENQKEVTKSTILKHYLSSLLVYGIVLLFISFCPAFRENVGDNGFNYITFFVIYYICYAFFALPIFFKTKPVSILNSKNVAILEYVKKQFTKTSTPEERLKVLEPNEFEKQSMVELFVKSFFGVYCINLICTKYLPTFDYNISFLKEMFSQAITYAASGQDLYKTNFLHFQYSLPNNYLSQYHHFQPSLNSVELLNNFLSTVFRFRLSVFY